MQLHTHLSFDGNCREAFEFYQRHLGGEITAMMTWADAPFADEVAPAIHDRIMHACLTFGEHALLGTDATEQNPYEEIKGVCVVINNPDPEEADRVFQALSEDGRVNMPMEETFWARRFGMTTDRYGVSWMINCGKEDWQ